MANHNGKLSWGATINTTGNRVCDPQGQFNREGGEFEAVTYADGVELEATRARENDFVMTVPLDRQAIKGGPPRIATSLHPRELQPCQGGRGCLEDAEVKLLNKTIKNNNVKLLAIYETWKTRVKAWIKDAEKPEIYKPMIGKRAAVSTTRGRHGTPKLRSSRPRTKGQRHKLKS